VLLLAALAWAGCRKPCAEIKDACECRERRDCKMVAEPCWCPSECNPEIVCVCGGGRFQRCE
jgi:hypothetical protein